MNKLERSLKKTTTTEADIGDGCFGIQQKIFEKKVVALRNIKFLSTEEHVFWEGQFFPFFLSGWGERGEIINHVSHHCSCVVNGGGGGGGSLIEGLERRGGTGGAGGVCVVDDV